MMNSTESITDGEIRAGESQAVGMCRCTVHQALLTLRIPVAPISAGYCQYPGTRAGEVEAQICLLDPALHLDGKEIAKGRWDSSTVAQALEVWDKLKAEEPET